MSKVLITGGTGFVGFWTAGWSSLETTVLSHNIYDNFSQWTDMDWDYIIHLAPIPIDRVIECAQKCKATVLLTSSGGVYDSNPTPYFRMKIEDEAKLLSSGLDVKIARVFTT